MEGNSQLPDVNQQFNALEDRVEWLLSTCRDLQREKAELEKKVEELEKASAGRDVYAQRYEEERVKIRSRIDSLVGRLNEVIGGAAS